ncbi:hypothetical protein L198_00643 [Cryptococcus wingfieldii CBS 7118]|uniref:Uncharacterized protein n=1 Tax=Cryptococcus wingfieldii CBS 7118 TaxID=1295528 RepID=A0A1E3K6T9_9TREE|nr:hypothetical protein L198_00643 [Cryptococcus wingfieldii CBS 7118]ODO08904.1 hypothetical protein L198_00643 [Cryptococcus wingfieldii CBS 7118]
MSHSAPTTHTTHLPSPFPSAPSFNFHLTLLTSTLFIWAGSGPASDSEGPGSLPGGGIGLEESGAGEVEGEAQGAGKRLEGEGVERRLAGDWAVAMPARGNIPVTATRLFRSGSTDIALPMSQRLAKKFPAHQVHLSLSLPPSLTQQSGSSIDPYASKILLVMEKKLGVWVGEVLAGEKGQ